MKEIKLNKGLVAKVDDEDYDRLNRFKWHVKVSGAYYYACRSIRKGDGNFDAKIMLSHEVLGIYDQQIMHVDGNQLNCQKSNLSASLAAFQSGSAGTLIYRINRLIRVYIEDTNYTTLLAICATLNQSPGEYIRELTIAKINEHNGNPATPTR